jgi:serine/threonine protein kinase/lipoprotein NlpI
MPADLGRVKELFLAATGLPAAERAAFLAEQCGGDAELRAAVERLLAAHDAPDDRVALSGVTPAGPAATGTFAPTNPDTDPARTATHHPSDAAGLVLAGRYKLVEPIGEGGMGTVWMAQQVEPVKRAVAVKLIKAGMDSRAVLARFEAERQALALMDHPNIARVLDAGLTADGRPFFVMELVKGVPITDFCDSRKLTPKQRLELFVPVCNAIQHAHQKGIIHRDIKPSNVLVALYDDKPVVKVIDFGVAKATGGTLTEHMIDTGFGAVVGTPQYMSPEQATFNNLDIDTRSDVYTLGVLLYELLTGTPPFSKKELEKRGLLEMLRVVREEEPPRPSTKLSTADALPTLSANRSMEPKKLTGLLRYELDWIVMKALEKDRTRRYESANGFAADVLRYLNGEAVQAHPPSAAYRLTKYIQRHRGQMVATAAVVVALGVGLAALSKLWVHISREEKETQERAAKELKAIDETRKVSLERLEMARTAIATGDHQRAGTLLSSSDPLLESAEPLQDVRDQLKTLRSQVEVYVEFKNVLDEARSALYGSLILPGKAVEPAVPIVQWGNAPFLQFGSLSLGSPGVGELESRRVKEQTQKYSRKLVEMAEQIREQKGSGAVGLPPLNAEQQRLFQEDMAEAYLIAAFLEADPAANDAAATRRAIDWLNRADRVLPGLRAIYVHRSVFWHAIGNRAENEVDQKRAQEVVPRSAVDRFWHGFAFHNRADEARRRGDQASAQDFLRQEVGEYAALLQIRPDHFWGYFNWARCEVDLGNLHLALIGYTACTRIRPDFPWPYNNRAMVNLRLREYEKALQDFNRALLLNADYVEARANRGLVYFKLGKAALAQADLNRAIALNSNYHPAYEYRAEVHRGLKEYAEAITDYQQVLTISQNKAPVYLKLADVHHEMGNDTAAVNDCTQAQALEPKNMQALYKRAGFQVLCKNYAEAVKDYSAVLNLVPKALEPRQDRARVYWLYLKEFDASLADWEELTKLQPKNPDPYYCIGVIHLGRRQYDNAKTALQTAIKLKPDYASAYWALAQTATWANGPKEAFEIIDPVTETLLVKHPETLNVRGDLYRSLGRLEDAVTDYRRLIALKPDLVETYVSLAQVFDKQGKPDLAKECFEKLVAANPKSSRAFLRRAAFHRDHRQFKDALEDCVRARDNDPKSPLPELMEASILAAQGSAEEAVTKAEKILAKGPKGDGELLYIAACTWSLASRAAATIPDKVMAEKLTKQYADRAAALLAECLDKGFHDLIYPEHNRMVDDRALEPVRNDPRVRDLVQHRH